MSKKRKLDAIVATFSQKGQAFFSSSSKPGKDYDYVKTYLVHASFDLFAVHHALPERRNEAGGDPADARSGSASGPGPSRSSKDRTIRVRMGTVSGYLILCPEMLYDQFDPLMVCDDHSAELEYVMSALTDEGAPLNGRTGEPKQNVFYIENLEIFSEYRTQRLGQRIMRELPYLVREFLHVFPDILAYRPAPIASDWDDVSERVNALRAFAMERLSNRIEMMLDDQRGSQVRGGSSRMPGGRLPKGAGSPKIGATKSDEPATVDSSLVSTLTITLPEYDFSDDEISLIMGRRSRISEYPEALKDQAAYRFFEKCGFREVPGSRLLSRRTM